MISSSAWYSRLCDFRREFEYSILEGPAAGESSDSAIAAQVADGMILVLTAHGTRRATVHRIQETLKSTQTHLLGTILAERQVSDSGGNLPAPVRTGCRLQMPVTIKTKDLTTEGTENAELYAIAQHRE